MIDPTVVGYGTFFVLIGAIVIGVPIAWAISGVSFIALFLLYGFGPTISQFYTTAFSSAGEFLFSAVPLFIFAGQLISKARIGEDLFDTMHKWFGRLPGGLLVSTVSASAAFGAVTGVSAAAVGTMAKVAMPEMIRYKYDVKMSAGAIACASTIAIMLPPSLLLIIYGLQTETSISKLFIAGIIPGILMAIVFSAYNIIRCSLSPELGPRGPRFSWRERFLSLGKLSPVVIIFGVVIGGLYNGFFTPGESAAVCAFSVLVYAVVTRRVKVRDIIDAAYDAVSLSAMVFAILIAMTVFSRVLIATRVTSDLVDVISSAGLNMYVVLALFVLLLLVLAMFLDALGMLLLTLPFMFPVIEGLGFDPVWFGIIIVLMSEVGLITPPVGMNIFILSKSLPDVPTLEMFRGAWPYVVLCLGLVVLFTIFPQMVLWLPNSM